MSTRIVVFASGSGSNLQALIDAEKNGELGDSKIVAIISDKFNAYALDRGKKAGIPGYVFSKKDYPEKKDREGAMKKLLFQKEVDLIVLAGYLQILSPDFIRTFQGRIINIHPSLLPAYGGKGFYGNHVHKAVIEAKEKESGATVHYVTDGVDEGPIILQESLLLEDDETVETLQKKILKIEHSLYKKAIKELVENKK